MSSDRSKPGDPTHEQAPSASQGNSQGTGAGAMVSQGNTISSRGATANVVSPTPPGTAHVNGGSPYYTRVPVEYQITDAVVALLKKRNLLRTFLTGRNQKLAGKWETTTVVCQLTKAVCRLLLDKSAVHQTPALKVHRWEDHRQLGILDHQADRFVVSDSVCVVLSQDPFREAQMEGWMTERMKLSMEVGTVLMMVEWDNTRKRRSQRRSILVQINDCIINKGGHITIMPEQQLKDAKNVHLKTDIDIAKSRYRQSNGGGARPSKGSCPEFSSSKFPSTAWRRPNVPHVVIDGIYIPLIRRDGLLTVTCRKPYPDEIRGLKRHVITREQPLDPRLSDDSDGISWLDDLSFPSIPSSAAVDGFSIASTAAVVDEGEFAHGRGDVIDSRIAKGGGELIEEVNGCVAVPSSPTVEGGGDGSGAGDDGSGAGDDDGGGERELIVDVRSSHNPRPSQSRKSKKSRSFCSAKFPTVALGAFGSVAITLACIISFTTIVPLAGAQRTSISLLDCGNDPFTDVYEEYLVAARRTQWQIDRLQTEQPSSDFINGDLNDEDDGQDSRSPVVDFTRDGKDHFYNDSFHDAIEPAPNWTRTSRTPFLYVRSRFLSSLGIRFIQVWQPTPILSMVLRQKGGAIYVQHRITGATSSSAANTTTTSNYIVMEEDAISTMEEDLLMRELLVKEEIAMEGR